MALTRLMSSGRRVQPSPVEPAVRPSSLSINSSSASAVSSTAVRQRLVSVLYRAARVAQSVAPQASFSEKASTNPAHSSFRSSR